MCLCRSIEPGQHEAVFQVDELRIGAVALCRLIAVLDGGDLAVGDDDGLLTQRLLTRVGQQPAGMNHDRSAKDHHSSSSRKLKVRED